MVLKRKQKNETNCLKYIYIIKDVYCRVYTDKHKLKVDTVCKVNLEVKLLLLPVTQQTSIFSKLCRFHFRVENRNSV